jgi:hypothetical protein
MVQLHQTQEAPYKGVLMPEETFRHYEFTREAYDELSRLNREGSSPMFCQEPQPVWYQSYFLWTAVGFIVGAIAFNHR